MKPRRADPSPEILDRSRGLTDPPARLRLRLADAPAPYLDGALDNPGIGADEVEMLLRNPGASAATLGRLGRNPAWMRIRDLRRAFVAHPAAPLVLARAQLPHLFCRDLAAVAADVRLSPPLRRDAERLLAVRLPELSLGERIALARVASPGLIGVLGRDGEGAVLRALAGNGRATEADVVAMASRADAPREFLGWLVEQSPWAARRAVRLAVVRHPRTPPAAALHAIAGLSARDLDDLLRDAGAPPLVRAALERRRCASGARAAAADRG